MHNESRARLSIFCLMVLLGLLAGGLPRSVHAQCWPKIDCSQSLVTSTPMDACFVGPVWHGGSGQCYFEQYTATATNPNALDFVKVFITNRQKAPLCWVGDDLNWPTGVKQDNQGERRYAQNWSPVSQVAGVRGMYFEFPTRRCFAFYKMSPPITMPLARMKNVYPGLYWIRGYVCGALGKGELSDTQIAGFINSIRVQEP